jgi:AAA family ATP:ADP antiporter
MTPRSEHESYQSFPVFKAVGEQQKNWLERSLSVFADVRVGEAAGVLLLTLNAFLLLAGYYMLKTAREALILTQGGAEVKSYSSAGQALILLALIPLYGAFASRVNRKRLITATMLFFMSHLAVFYFLGQRGMREGVVYFLWVGIFNVFVISQFWAFVNDLYTEPQGKRLFPIIGFGSSAGAWLGAVAASRISHYFKPYTLMLNAEALLAICLGLILIVNARESKAARGERAKEADAALGTEGGFELVFRDRYLLLIAALIVVLNVVNTSGEFLLGKFVVSKAASLFGSGAEMADTRESFVGEFYGQYFSWVGLTGLVLQMFFVSRIFRYIGVRGAVFILPSIALAGYTILLVAPVLALVRTLKILENGTDYSIQNTTRQALFLPTSREAKYKAKAAIDTFFMRAGDVLQAGITYVGTQLSFGLSAFAGVNIVLTLAWLGIALGIYREHERRTSSIAAPAAPAPREAPAVGS